TATIAALLGLECKVFMGAKDAKRQELNVFRMELLGAEVIRVEQGTATLKDAVNEAMRYWVEHMDDTHYIIGDRKSTRLNSSHVSISYAVFCLKKKNKQAR